MLKKQIYPLFLILLCALLLLGGGAFFIFLTQYNALTPADNQHQPQARVILLDDAWAQTTFASEIVADQQAAIDESLAAIQALGANAVALTARMPSGEAIWRDETETLTTYPNITKTDHFFAKFDAFDDFVASAAALEIEVILLPTDENGDLLAAADALPSFLTPLVAQYDLRLLYENPVTVVLDVQETQGDDSPQTENLLGVAQNTTTYSYTLTASDATTTTLYRNDTSPITFAQELQATGTDQIVLGSLSDLLADSTNLNLFWAYYANGEALPDLTQYLQTDYARTLAITYPTEDGSTVSDSTLFLMGTSDPDLPLSLADVEIPRYGTQGVWGILVDLSWGENTFTVTNGSESISYTVTRKSSGDGGSTSDGSAAYYTLDEGQTILITSEIASALSNAYSASTITQTFYKGAVACVTRYVSYAGSSEAYAYQLTNGDWVRASTCALYNTEKTHLSEDTLTFDAEINATKITLTGGTPAVYHLWEEDTLTLTLMNCTYGGSAPSSDWFRSTVSDDGSNTIFTFTFGADEPLYGWTVTYDSDTQTTTLALKQSPQLSEDASAPLSGLRVLLDAGHGLEDLGAMGAGGLDAPCEKDVNLALTMATKYRLEQLGATVILTRAEDRFPTLDDRVAALNNIQPDFFISIHHNSLELVSDLNTATGVEAYWFYDEADLFANDLIAAVSDAADRNMRSVSYGYYYVTRSNICPATLLEVGFMTNPWEYESVTDTDILWAEAGAIAQTIYNTVANNAP